MNGQHPSERVRVVRLPPAVQQQLDHGGASCHRCGVQRGHTFGSDMVDYCAVFEEHFHGSFAASGVGGCQIQGGKAGSVFDVYLGEGRGEVRKYQRGQRRDKNQDRLDR